MDKTIIGIKIRGNRRTKEMLMAAVMLVVIFAILFLIGWLQVSLCKDKQPGLSTYQCLTDPTARFNKGV